MNNKILKSKTKVLILAAGKGSRLKELTNSMPKCMLDFRGKTLLERQISSFNKCGLKDISVVRGYKKNKINFNGLKYFDNNDYENNNILNSIFYAHKIIEGDIIISYSDILFDYKIVNKLLKSNHNFTAVIDVDWKKNYKNRTLHPLSEAENVIYNKSNEILKIGKNILSNKNITNLNGKLIKKSIIINNKLSFKNELRYLEDETFVWDILGYVNNMKYVNMQLYNYYSNENLNTARSEGLSRNFPLSNFKIIKNHVQNCFKIRGVSSKEIIKLGDQALIFFIIYALVSLSLSMLTGKANYEKGNKFRRKIIDDVIVDRDVLNAIKNYSCSKNESPWIPKSIFLRSRKLIELTCTGRANKIIKNMRRDVRAV